MGRRQPRPQKPGELLGRSRVRAEWHNMAFFETIGIPSARRVVLVEGRGAGDHEGAIVTEEVPSTVDLDTIATQAPRHLDDREWLEAVIDRLAGYVRSLHDVHFVHNDLKFRNVLVEFSCDPEVYIIDCPQGRRLPPPLLQRGIVKDLACLDRMARRCLSRTRRLRFFKRYHRTNRLSRAQRRQLQRIVTFFENGDPTD